MIGSTLLVLLLASSTSAVAQVGAATSPGTPGTSLGSSGPVLRKPPATNRDAATCERLQGEARESCLRRAESPTPASPGAPATGMASGQSASGASGTTGPGTGTAPGMTTR
jgi:hypothetical protein